MGMGEVKGKDVEREEVEVLQCTWLWGGAGTRLGWEVRQSQDPERHFGFPLTSFGSGGLFIRDREIRHFSQSRGQWSSGDLNSVLEVQWDFSPGDDGRGSSSGAPFSHLILL